jgi:hypothetical protein
MIWERILKSETVFCEVFNREEEFSILVNGDLKKILEQMLYVTIALIFCCQNNVLACCVRAYVLCALMKFSEITSDTIFNSFDILAPIFLLGCYFSEALQGMRLNLQSAVSSACWFRNPVYKEQTK